MLLTWLKSPSYREYDEMVRRRQPKISPEDLEKLRNEELVTWFRKRVSVDHTIDRNIKDIGIGAYREVDSYGAYDVNGYRFHT
jgi:hypothetical protein